MHVSALPLSGTQGHPGAAITYGLLAVGIQRGAANPPPYVQPFDH
jgi:hypothetical protein